MTRELLKIQNIVISDDGYALQDGGMYNDFVWNEV
jgi:hypothetical protein